MRLRSALAAFASISALGFTAFPQTPLFAQSVRYRDFWADNYGDGLDFDNAQDTVIAQDGPMMGLTNPQMRDGLLSFTVNKPGYFSPLWGGYADSIPHGREGSLRPIDTSKYNQIVIRMRASADIDSGIRWYTCKGGVADFCQGGFNFKAEAGWHTYVFPMKNQADDPALQHSGWKNRVSGIRMAFGAATGTNVDVDFVRLVGPDPTGPVNADWQIDRPLGRPAWLGPIDPTPPKGADYNDAARKGDRWDFNQPTDIKRVGNLQAYQIGNGQLTGVSKASPDKRPGDPFVEMALGKTPIDTKKYSQVSIRMKLAGEYSQAFEAGGGSALRFRMKLKGNPNFVLTRPIAVYPNEEWITFNLNDMYPYDSTPGSFVDVIDPAYTKGAAHTTGASDLTEAEVAPAMAGFKMPTGKSSNLSVPVSVTSNWSHWIVSLGIDPTEDYGARSFAIQNMYVGILGTPEAWAPWTERQSAETPISGLGVNSLGK